MDLPKDGKQVAQADCVTVKGELGDFGVACCASANGTVVGIFHLPACVARLHFLHTDNILIDGFQAPETAAAKCDLLSCHSCLL